MIPIEDFFKSESMKAARQLADRLERDHVDREPSYDSRDDRDAEPREDRRGGRNQRRPKPRRDLRKDKKDRKSSAREEEGEFYVKKTAGTPVAAPKDSEDY